MSAVDDSIEHMFDTGGMGTAAMIDGRREQADRIGELRDRMRRMQQPDLAPRLLPTLPAVAGLLPGGGLRPGTSYSITGSVGLAMALMAGPVSAGAWCGVIGVPEFGIEAAEGIGVDLARVVFVPDPGKQWLTVVAALVDALDVVVVRPGGRVSDSVASRLGARLRRRDGVLIALGDWAPAEVRLAVEGGGWRGLGSGFGHLSGRRVVVQVRDRTGRTRERGYEVTEAGVVAAGSTQAQPEVPAAGTRSAGVPSMLGRSAGRPLTRVS